MSVRAFFRAAKVEQAAPPHDTIHLKVFYPAQLSASDRELNSGEVPADPQRSPFPVVILFNGFNCGAEIYQWLALKLVERGLVVVTFNLLQEDPFSISRLPSHRNKSVL